MGNEQALNLADTYKCVDALLGVLTDLIRADQAYVLSPDEDVKQLIHLVAMYLDHNNYPTSHVYSVLASSLFILESIARVRQEEDEATKDFEFPSEFHSWRRNSLSFGNRWTLRQKVDSSAAHPCRGRCHQLSGASSSNAPRRSRPSEGRAGPPLVG